MVYIYIEQPKIVGKSEHPSEQVQQRPHEHICST